MPTADFAAAVSSHAARIAPRHVAQFASGVHCERMNGVQAAGSNTNTSPSSERQPIVSAIKSDLTLVATTGPGHSRIAGIARPVVFPVWVGPSTRRLWRDSTATSRRKAMVPTTSRPCLDPRTCSPRSCRAVAHFALYEGRRRRRTRTTTTTTGPTHRAANTSHHRSGPGGLPPRLTGSHARPGSAGWAMTRPMMPGASRSR